jgi:hypothetical protein
MNKDFKLFQSEFKKWQRLFGLTGYKVYFKYEPLEKSFADIEINQEETVATVRLNSELPDKDKPFKDIRRHAKHEALHLLIGRLEMNGSYRFVSSGEMHESSEELVHKLENLIP